MKRACQRANCMVVNLQVMFAGLLCYRHIFLSFFKWPIAIFILGHVFILEIFIC